MVCRAGRRGSLEVDGYTSSEEESGGLLTGLNTSGNLYIGTTFIHFRCLSISTEDVRLCQFTTLMILSSTTAATLRWFTAGGAIRIALRQLLQNRK